MNEDGSWIRNGPPVTDEHLPTKITCPITHDSRFIALGLFKSTGSHVVDGEIADGLLGLVHTRGGIKTSSSGPTRTHRKGGTPYSKPKNDTKQWSTPMQPTHPAFKPTASTTTSDPTKTASTNPFPPSTPSNGKKNRKNKKGKKPGDTASSVSALASAVPTTTAAPIVAPTVPAPAVVPATSNEAPVEIDDTEMADADNIKPGDDDETVLKKADALFRADS
ncbi:hypothetical protein BDN72DRAFT_864914 [Pluteus cervinus]|uniref:Uncharacterized protein n=1 Tax=Pluteus cervinus TaxID=181527 RepID=A0ACD3A1Z1_9AGAR|nr:hypothetical protein BDN72DRAFT_864914 [Pluteus cervinus]